MHQYAQLLHWQLHSEYRPGYHNLVAPDVRDLQVTEDETEDEDHGGVYVCVGQLVSRSFDILSPNNVDLPGSTSVCIISGLRLHYLLGMNEDDVTCKACPD